MDLLSEAEREIEKIREENSSLKEKSVELSSRLDSEIEEKNAIHAKYNQVHKTNTQHVELLSEAEKEIEKLATERNAATVRYVSPVQIISNSNNSLFLSLSLTGSTSQVGKGCQDFEEETQELGTGSRLESEECEESGKSSLRSSGQT